MIPFAENPELVPLDENSELVPFAENLQLVHLAENPELEPSAGNPELSKSFFKKKILALVRSESVRLNPLTDLVVGAGGRGQAR